MKITVKPQPTSYQVESILADMFPDTYAEDTSGMERNVRAVIEFGRAMELSSQEQWGLLFNFARLVKDLSCRELQFPVSARSPEPTEESLKVVPEPDF